ncbi:MAG: hypothetical protein SF097_20665 [Acidobacteriota bacterium]|nr:hypothetical protein [Acidobacteriota bacterium]
MIQNDLELAGTQERIAFFCRIVANMRKVESQKNFPYMASGYLAEIEKMNAEVLEYLKRPANEIELAKAA